MIYEHDELKIINHTKVRVPWNKGLKGAQPLRIGFKHSIESRKKIIDSKKGVSIASKGKPSWRKGISKKIPETKICVNCKNSYDKNLKKTEKEWQERKYCSAKCSLNVTQKARAGTQLSEKWKKNLSLSHIGNEPGNKGKKSPKTSGENNPNWKGGITSENEKIRKSIEWMVLFES